MSDSNEHAGFVAPEPADLSPFFPGYEIESLIATGGMGAVYCAVQKSLDRTVALKILPMEFSKDPGFCAGFEAEAKAMARLNHPNLIGVYDFGEVNGMLYIIMEYVRGKSVYHSAYRTAIDPAEVVRLVTGICNGLAHAHENGILHRDIKPSNILLDLNAEPKIGDFGLARPVDRKMEENEEIFGTPHYTAPEVVNSPHSVDYRADIFSVGVLLHELLTGRLPAEDPRPASMIVRCDTRFDAIIKRATQPVPAARYASAKEMAKDLQAIPLASAHNVPRAGAAAPRRPTPKRVRRVTTAQKSSNSSAMIVVMIVVLAGLGAFAYFSTKEPEKPPEVALPAPLETKVNEPVAPIPVAEEDEPLLMPESVGEDRSDADPVPEDPADGLTGIENEPDETDPNADGPRYDVDGLFERGRKIIRDKAQPQIQVYQSSLGGNISNYERALVPLVRKVRSNDGLAATVTETIAGWRAEGNRIPKSVPSELQEIPEIEDTHFIHLQKQTGIDDKLEMSLAPLSATYVLGLEKQIERLEGENDPAAIKLIREEIKRTRDELGYFTGLMLDTPDAE